MSVIGVAVNDQILSFTNMPTISAGNAGIDSVKFDFKDSVWDGYGITCVFFKDKNAYYPIVLDKDNIAKIPMPVLRNKGIIHFGLSATKDDNRLTSTILAYTIEDGVFYSGDEYDDVLTKTVYEEILENYESIKGENQKIKEENQEIKDSISALQSADEAFAEDIKKLKSADTTFTTNISNLNSNINDLNQSMKNNDALLQKDIDALALSLKGLVFNVKDYGAVGDGSVNDVAAIRSALSDAANAGGGTVYFPNGTYWFGSTVTFASNIRILGGTNTVFTAEPPNPKSTGLRHSTFLEIGSAGAAKYNGFKNVTIENIIFDLGGTWSLNGDILTYAAKYDTNHKYTNNDYLSYCPIVACHGDGLIIKNCTFKNGIYAGYTGSPGSSGVYATNPHIMDLGGVKNLLIEGCTFDTVLTTSTSMINWTGGVNSETGQSDVNYSDLIQLDACYDDGGISGIKGSADGTNCKDVIIRNNKFYGLPDFDWKTVVNNTVDAKDGTTKENNKLLSGTNNAGVAVNYSEFRFAKYAAIGCCHVTDSASLTKQPDNVEIYDNYFEHSWSSHYCNSNAKASGSYDTDEDGINYPIVNKKWEPARKFCHGAIYAYPGAKNYNIHNNTFRETTNYTLNKSTAVFLYGSKVGIVHDNTFINYGEPLPVGNKTEKMSNISFSSTDAWSSSQTGYYDGYAYCKSSNNLWIKVTDDSDESEVLSVFSTSQG